MQKLIGNYAFEPKYRDVIPTDSAKLMKCKSSAFVGVSRWSWILVDVPINKERWLPQGGHQCGACHNVSDAKVSIRKPLENNTEY